MCVYYCIYIFWQSLSIFLVLALQTAARKKKQLLVLVILPHRNELICFLCFLSFFSFAVLHKGSVLVHNRFHES